MSANPAPARHSIDISAVISRIVEIYGQYLGPLVLAAAIVFLPVALLAALLAGSAVGALIVFVVSIVARLWYTGVVVRLVQDVQDGQLDQSVGQLFNSVMPVLLPLFGLGVVAGVAIGIGFMLLIVPGLILVTIWAVAAPVLVLERKGVFASLGRSRELVRGNGWQVFGVIVALVAIGIVISLVIGAIGAIGNSVGLRFVVELIIEVLLAPILALAASTIYFALRDAHGEGALPAFEAPVPPGPPVAPATPAAPAPAQPGTDAFGNPTAPPAAAPQAPPSAPEGFEPPQTPPSAPAEREGGSIPPPSIPPPAS